VPEIYPKFRNDLEIVPYQSEGNGIRYLVKIPDADEDFEFGEKEYFICQHFDGKTTASKIIDVFKIEFNINLELEQLNAFICNLASVDLLIDDGSIVKNPLPIEMDIKIWSLCNPDPLFRYISQKLSWCFSNLFTSLTILLTIVAMGISVKYGGDFFYGLNSTFRHERFIFFLTIPSFGFFLIYPLGELAKGVACRHYRCQVPEFNLGFLYRFIPRFSANIWDALWFLTKEQRIKVFAAGPLSQLLIFDFSIIAWNQTTYCTPVSFFWSFLILSSAIYLLLNLNPFIQRDGYFMLVNWLEIRDLHDRAERWATACFFHDPKPEPLDASEKKIFFWYGGFSLFFSAFFTCVVLWLAGQVLTDSFKGIGALLFLGVVYFRFEDFIQEQWLCIPLIRGKIMNQRGFITKNIIKNIALVVLLLIFFMLPYPYEIGGDFRVFPEKQLGVRAEIAATIKEVLVHENDLVTKGQPLAILDDSLPKKQIEVTQASIDEAKAMLALRQKGGKPEEIAKAEQEVETAAKALEYSAQEANRYKKMFDQKAIPETEYQSAAMRRDLDRERLEITKKELAIVKSGAQDEEIEAMKAKIRRLTVELKHAEEALSYTTLVSPIDGRIINPYLSQKIGQHIELGELFAVVEATSSYIAEIEVPEEDISEVKIGAQVKLRTWSNPNSTLHAQTSAIAPVAYDQSWRKVTRTLSERESYIGQKEVLRDKGKVIRVLAEFPADKLSVRSDMTGYAKIECENKPLIVAFTHWMIRFVLVEIWSWIP
jgi:multidrug resistance efflux pump